MNQEHNGDGILKSHGGRFVKVEEENQIDEDGIKKEKFIDSKDYLSDM